MEARIQLTSAGAPHWGREECVLMKYDTAMSATLTLPCKLKATEAQTAKLSATLSAFTQALNWVNAHTPTQIANALKLQSLCYYEVRARFGLSSNLAQQVCRRQGYRKPALYASA
jgi:putative transposase